MRYLRIFFLHFQQAFALRSRSVVWFLLSLFNPLIFYLFWKSVYHENSMTFSDWSLSNVASYYFFLVIAGSLLIVHIEEDVAHWDIQQGGLSRYLLKPFSYMKMKFFEELPWRIIQGFFGVFVLVLFSIFFGNLLSFVKIPFGIFLASIIVILAYSISFIFKMIVGISALWFTDFSGLQQVLEAILIVFTGSLMPLAFLPDIIHQLALVLPFAYIIYFPILAVQGKMQVWESLRVIGVQLLWVMLLLSFYKFLWKKGVKLYTGLGQ